METININKINENSTTALIAGYTKVINSIENKVLNSNGKFIIDGDNIDQAKVTIAIQDLGISDRRRYRNMMNKVMLGGTLRSINRFLHFTVRKVLKQTKEDGRLQKVKEPQHEKIQDMRKVWKELQLKADAALAAYKSEKGDYYKS